MPAPRTRTLTILGIPVTLRPPTEAEALALDEARLRTMERNRLIEDEGARDYFDDGDNEVLACVTLPDRATMLGLLEEAPLVIDEIEEAVRELGRYEVQLLAAPDLAKAAAANGGRYLAYHLGEQPIIVQRRDRLEQKMMARQARGKRLPVSELARLAKARVVGEVPAALWDEYPWLSLALARKLTEAARGREEAAAGKN